jgi:Chaperone of endosialidase/Head domain of trimeric autotransporter adhesin
MSDEAVYIKQLKTGNNLGAFKITADNYTTPTVSLLNPNESTPGYAVNLTSFVVGSTQLDDTGLPDNDTRMLFDKTTGAFRAGTANSTQWDNTLANPNRGSNSVALGLNNIARGIHSAVIGYSNTVTGAYSYILGSSNVITDSHSVAIGDSNNINSQSATAIGTNNTVMSDNSYAIGHYNELTEYSLQFAIGAYNIISSDKSITIGYNCIASTQPNATAIGKFCTASGANSFAIGYGIDATTNANKASGTGSISIGYKNNVIGDNSVAIGYSNTIISGATKAFILGSGCLINNIGASNAIVMGLNAQINHACARGLFWSGASTADDAKIMNASFPAGSAQFDCGSGSNFAITFNDGAVVNTSSITGYSWSSTSDINLKENLVEHTYSDTLDKIMEMPIYTYNFKTTAPGIKSIGPVAQDFNRLFPSDKDQLSIVERDMCGVALAGVKGVKLRLDSLSNTVNSRFETVDSRFTSSTDVTLALQARIDVLESLLTTAITRITTLEDA